MIKKSIGLLAGMLVTVAVYAAGASLRTDHPDSYVVRRGDTLWGISARFLSKPWLWPEIWQANPQVHNPHRIYPGDVLDLSFSNGGPQLTLEPRVHVESEAIPAIPLGQLKMFLKDTRVLDPAVVRAAPYVVGVQEAQLEATVGQNVYVRNLPGGPGQRWAIVRPTHVFRAFDKDGHDDATGDLVADPLDANVDLVGPPWSEDFRDSGHAGRGHTLGVEVTVIGTAETLRMGDPSTVLLLDATREVQAGDRLLPVEDKPYDPYYYPHAPKSVPPDARIIAFTDALDAVGPHQVVTLSIGARDGVDNGTTYSVFQPGDEVQDEVASSSWRPAFGKYVRLPPEYIGHVMVFRTFDRVSYALVMDGLRPVKLGDTLRMPE